MAKMGLQFGLEGNGKFCKRQFRWEFTIPEVAADRTVGVNALPPEKASRPQLAFKEMEVKHLHEDIFYPAKPDWKPVTITLYDLAHSTNPVWEWIRKIYRPALNQYVFIEPNSPDFIKECNLSLYNGCGTEVVERWIWEDCWCQSVNFQTLDMTQNGIVMCEITLRYARAYII